MLGKMRIVVLICFLMLFCITSIYAGGTAGRVPTEPGTGVASNNVVSTAKNVWSTAAAVIQILAIAAIVFSGLRYMFASADTKADIKKQLIILVIGAVLVFCSVEVANLIYNAGKTVIATTP